MMWEGISIQGKTDMYIIQNGTLMATRDVNEILDVYVYTYAGAVSPDFILMDENAHPHRAPVTNEYLQTTTETMDRPARSQDLNPI